jgi:hypothetical protein
MGSIATLMVHRVTTMTGEAPEEANDRIRVTELNRPEGDARPAGKERGPSIQRLRLLGCARCRRIWELILNEVNRALVVAIEDRPNGTWENLERILSLLGFDQPRDSHSTWTSFWGADHLPT